METITDILLSNSLDFEIPAIKRAMRIYKKPRKVLDKSYVDYLCENQAHVASILAKYGKVKPHSEFDDLYPSEIY